MDNKAIGWTFTANGFKNSVIIIYILTIAFARDSWEGYGISYIFYAGDQHDKSLKAKTKSCMRNSSVSSKIKIELVVFFFKVASLELLQ